jgi:hypothetical protein
LLVVKRELLNNSNSSIAILHAHLARLIVFGGALYELPNSRTDRRLPYASGLPLAGAASAFAYAPIRTPRPKGTVAALGCLGLDEFAFEFRKAAQDGHISRQAVLVVSARFSPRDRNDALVCNGLQQHQQINGGLCQHIPAS